VHRGAGAYICGEETALLDSLEGKRGNPRLKPPFPAVQGLYQGPTLINNVETLMNVPVVLRMGGAEYAKIGTETSTGTKLISISGQIKYPGNYEIVLGTKVRDILFDLAGGPLDGQSFKAFFPGGSSSPVLPLDDAALDLDYDFDSLAKAGSMLGSGAIIVFDDSTSIVDVAYKTAHFYRHESCGKCTPCREGTNWTEKMLLRIKNGDATPMDLDIMASVCQQMMGSALCVLADAMAMPVGSMIKHFRPEFEAYIEAKREERGFGAAIPQVNRGANAGPGPLLEPVAVA
jgi:NADH-quinone oxidoreductase subunit F